MEIGPLLNGLKMFDNKSALKQLRGIKRSINEAKSSLKELEAMLHEEETKAEAQAVSIQ